MKFAAAALLTAAVALSSCASAPEKQAEAPHIQASDPAQYYDLHQVLLVQGHPQVAGKALTQEELADYYRKNDCPSALALLQGPHNPSQGQHLGAILVGGFLGGILGGLSQLGRPADSGAVLPLMAGGAALGIGIGEWAMAYQPKLRESTETFNSSLARRLGLDL
jgi:hypothetical protein